VLCSVGSIEPECIALSGSTASTTLKVRAHRSIYAFWSVLALILFKTPRGRGDLCVHTKTPPATIRRVDLIRAAFQLGLDINCKGWINCRKGARPRSSGFGDQCRGRKSDDSRRQGTGSGPHHIPPCTLGQVRRIPCDATAKTSTRELFALDGLGNSSGRQAASFLDDVLQV